MLLISTIWLPIVASALLVFVVSAVVHMFLPYHRTEPAPAPGTEAIQAALRGAAPGWYGFPLAPEVKDRMKPEWVKRWAEGPSGWLVVMGKGPVNMPRNLALSLLVNLAVSFFVGYAAWHAFSSPPAYKDVFKVTAALGFMAYGFAPGFDTIWYGKPWRSWFFTGLDALLYALVMGGAFGWLWPR